MREGADRALWKIGPEAVPALIQALEDRDSDVRRYAARALGDFGREAEKAIPALIQTLRDDGFWVSADAAEALERITGQGYGHDVARWQAWWEAQQ